MADRGDDGSGRHVTKDNLEQFHLISRQQQQLQQQQQQQQLFLHNVRMCATDGFDWLSESRYHDVDVTYSYAASSADTMEFNCDWDEADIERQLDWRNEARQHPSSAIDDEANFDDELIEYGCDVVVAAAAAEDFNFAILDSIISPCCAAGNVKPEDYYTDEYYAWNCILEEKYYPGNSLDNQPQVKSENRATLVAWLSKVIRSLDLFPETLFLTVNVVDRFLARTPIAIECFQLLGLSALFIASKQLEIYHPSVMELLKLSAGVYSKQQFLQMERIILKQLQFNLVVATSLFFVEYYITWRPDNAAKSGSAEFAVLMERPYRTMVRNLVELCVQDYNLCQYASSCVALSSMAVVEEYSLGRPVDLTAARYARWDYEPALLKQCTTDIWLHLSRALHGSVRQLSEEMFFDDDDDYDPSADAT